METINQTVAPYMARIQALGATPVQAIDSLLKADHILATAPRQQKAEYLAKLISDYDVDVSDLDAAIVSMMKGKTQQPSQTQAFDPNYVNQLVKQQLEQALAPIYQERDAKKQAEQQQFQHTIESMSLDPKYPYFEDVRNDMADLIELRAKRGVALSLEDAYDMAVRSNPDTYGQLSQQQSAAQANQQHLQAQRAKIAASSVTGAPAGGGSQSYNGDGSLRSQIEAAFNNSRI
jgi:acetyl/propionyl-CoA carboxylase alpha subunit